jgi:hypothetical protein
VGGGNDLFYLLCRGKLKFLDGASGSIDACGSALTVG